MRREPGAVRNNPHTGCPLAHSALSQIPNPHSLTHIHTQGAREPEPARGRGPGGRRRAVQLHGRRAAWLRGRQAAASLHGPSSSSTRPTTSPSSLRLRRPRGRGPSQALLEEVMVAAQLARIGAALPTWQPSSPGSPAPLPPPAAGSGSERGELQ